MLNLLITSILPLINKVIPDKDKAQEIAAELATLAERQAHELAKLQVETNKAEAAHRSLFVSSWRPACGWVCVFGFGFNYIVLPFMSYFGQFWDVPPMAPLDLSMMMPVLMGMLGLGGLRSVERIKGVIPQGR